MSRKSKRNQSTPDSQNPDWCRTASTRLAGAPVYAQCLLEIPGASPLVDEVAQGRAADLDRFFKNTPDVRRQELVADAPYTPG